MHEKRSTAHIKGHLLLAAGSTATHMIDSRISGAHGRLNLPSRNPDLMSSAFSHLLLFGNRRWLNPNLLHEIEKKIIYLSYSQIA